MIANLLPQLMDRRGMSIRQLSRETGVTYSTVWALVHGQRRSVQLEVLDAVCAALGVQPGDIYRRVAPGQELPAVAVMEKQSKPQAAPVAEQPARPAGEDSRREWRSW